MTQNRNQNVYLRGIEIQLIWYIISGGEYIDWALKEDLRENGNYDEDKDFQFLIS